jgi:hypothetical protein
MNKQAISSMLVLCAVLILAAASRATTSQGQWMVTVSTTAAPSVFNYPGAALTPVSEAQVSYAYSTSDDAPTVYENFWGANGTPLALERYVPFDVPRGQGVIFKIVNDTEQPPYAQTQLAVDAILRLMLDAQLNANPVLYVSVPPTCYADVVNAFVQQNFIVKDTSLETPLQGAALVVYLVDYNGQTRKTLYYPE